MNELTRRVLFGIPAATLFLFLIWLGDLAFAIFSGILALAVVIEMIILFNKMKIYPIAVISIILGGIIWTIPILPPWALLTIVVVILLITLWAAIGREGELANRWLVSLYCGVYAPLSFFLLYQIRNLDPEFSGMWLTFALVIMIWGNDSFAYFGGRRFGSRLLAPSISPKKTWEGFWSGFAGALAGLLIIYWIADPFPLTFITALPLVFLISIAGPAGDLTESRLKRIAGVKDSSSLLPGHGGFFDRFDALILCTPLVFIYLKWVF
ncbi:MAG: phosphatidate cytidylyltransferase [Balneolaceae bacterium]